MRFACLPMLFFTTLPVLAATPTLTSDAWNWVDVPTAHCANGTPTGAAVNPHPGATKLLIYLQGGGLCTDENSCWGSSPAASNLNGYNAASFAADGTVNAPLFQRIAGAPFADATMIYVPYCTGDLHMGTAISNLPTPTWFVGGDNLEQYMAQAHAAFPEIQHVWISGSSAGGAGALMNQYFAVQAFGGVPVDVIDDSAPPVTNPYLGVPAVWNVKQPPDCPDCTVDLMDGYYGYDRSHFPYSRFAMMVYALDTTLPSYWNVSLMSFAAQSAAELQQDTQDPLVQSFKVMSSGHVVLGASQSNVQSKAMSWLSDMVSGSSRWKNTSVVPLR